MRFIDTVIVHCSATKASMDIGVEEIRRWHMDRGWHDIGYHYVIRRDGHIEVGRPEASTGAHTKGHNSTSIGVCLVGGIDDEGAPEFNFTRHQMDVLEYFTELLTERHDITKVLGHNDFTDKKACPCFNVPAWWGEPEKGGEDIYG